MRSGVVGGAVLSLVLIGLALPAAQGSRAIVDLKRGSQLAAPLPLDYIATAGESHGGDEQGPGRSLEAEGDVRPVRIRRMLAEPYLADGFETTGSLDYPPATHGGPMDSISAPTNATDDSGGFSQEGPGNATDAMDSAEQPSANIEEGDTESPEESITSNPAGGDATNPEVSQAEPSADPAGESDGADKSQILVPEQGTSAAQKVGSPLTGSDSAGFKTTELEPAAAPAKSNGTEPESAADGMAGNETAVGNGDAMNSIPAPAKAAEDPGASLEQSEGVVQKVGPALTGSNTGSDSEGDGTVSAGNATAPAANVPATNGTSDAKVGRTNATPEEPNTTEREPAPAESNGTAGNETAVGDGEDKNPIPAPAKATEGSGAGSEAPGNGADSMNSAEQPSGSSFPSEESQQEARQSGRPARGSGTESRTGYENGSAYERFGIGGDFHASFGIGGDFSQTGYGSGTRRFVPRNPSPGIATGAGSDTKQESPGYGRVARYGSRTRSFEPSEESKHKFESSESSAASAAAAVPALAMVCLSALLM